MVSVCGGVGCVNSYGFYCRWQRLDHRIWGFDVYKIVMKL